VTDISTDRNKSWHRTLGSLDTNLFVEAPRSLKVVRTKLVYRLLIFWLRLPSLNKRFKSAWAVA